MIVSDAPYKTRSLYEESKCGTNITIINEDEYYLLERNGTSYADKLVVFTIDDKYVDYLI